MRAGCQSSQGHHFYQQSLARCETTVLETEQKEEEEKAVVRKKAQVTHAQLFQIQLPGTVGTSEPVSHFSSPSK